MKDSRKNNTQDSKSKVRQCRGHDHHDAPCRDVENAGKKTFEMKRKADDAHDHIRTYRVDVDEQQKSSRRLRRTSMTAQDVWANP